MSDAATHFRVTTYSNNMRDFVTSLNWSEIFHCRSLAERSVRIEFSKERYSRIIEEQCSCVLLDWAVKEEKEFCASGSAQ